jgi:sulfur carrier protein
LQALYGLAFLFLQYSLLGGEIMIINGIQMDFENGITITSLLTHLNLCAGKVVIEVNYEIIPKENFENHKLYETDSIEVVSFVGGG